MKGIIPAEDAPPEAEEARLFEVSFTCVIPPEIKVPRGAKDWIQMLYVMKDYGDQNGTPEIVTLSRLWELKLPMAEDAIEAMNAAGS